MSPAAAATKGGWAPCESASSKALTFLLGTGFRDVQRQDPPPVGSWVPYTHRGHTAEGVPRFASFLRLRSEHF
jgi:DNA ligase-1